MNNSLYILDDSPRFEWIRLSSTDSTSNFLKNYRPAAAREMTLVTADYQTAGRGQAGNSWESEVGRTLLFSLRLQPVGLDVRRQFILSQAMSVAICTALRELLPDGVSIKWPNDIYWHHRKVCGFLVENFLTGHSIDTCIIGAGINVNQTVFLSDAPNPVSLKQITGQDTECVFLLARIVELFRSHYARIQAGDTAAITAAYRQMLYRATGFYAYADKDGTFEAEIHDIEPTGHLILADRAGTLRRYAFKEVRSLIPDGDSSLTAL